MVITEEARGIVLEFSQGTKEVLQFYFVLTQYQCKMTQCNTLNVKLPNFQLKKLKSGIKCGIEVTLKL